MELNRLLSCQVLLYIWFACVMRCRFFKRLSFPWVMRTKCGVGLHVDQLFFCLQLEEAAIQLVVFGLLQSLHNKRPVVIHAYCCPVPIFWPYPMFLTACLHLLLKVTPIRYLWWQGLHLKQPACVHKGLVNDTKANNRHTATAISPSTIDTKQDLTHLW